MRAYYQDPLPGMPDPPPRKPPRKGSTRPVWRLMGVNPPVCTRCALEAYQEGRWGHVEFAAYKRIARAGDRGLPDATFWCPVHAEEQRQIDGATLPRRPTRGP